MLSIPFPTTTTTTTTLSSSSIPFTHHPATHNTNNNEPHSVTTPSSPPTSDLNENTSPLLHCFLAGGLGGAVGDSVMHSLDTVKTRQQGSPSTLKYRNTIPAYLTILREEGFARGLYGGYGAAMLGSFPSAAVFFITYESTKRKMIDDWKIPDTVTHLTAGFLGDFASSIFYVPSEVLKTRLQLQGRLNNPFFESGYNYKSTFDAIKMICQLEGPGTLFYGYKATLVRDLPFSALQLAFYEKFRDLAFNFTDSSNSSSGGGEEKELSVVHELLVGASAGGLAGIITTPLDVIKTRVQTQQQHKHKQLILSSSIWNSLKTVARQEGVFGLFSGVGPRFVWTSVQSSIMLFLYQVSLRQFDKYFQK